MKRNQIDSVNMTKRLRENKKYGRWQIFAKLLHQTQTKMGISK